MSDQDYRQYENNFVRAGLARPGRAAAKTMSRRERRDYVASLAALPAFAECDKSDLTALVDAATPFACPAHWPIAHAAAPLSACHVILEGRARIVREGIAASGHHIGAGELLHAVSTLPDGAHGASVVTVERLSGLRIGNDELLALCVKRPRLTSALQMGSVQRETRAVATHVVPTHELFAQPAVSLV